MRSLLIAAVLAACGSQERAPAAEDIAVAPLAPPAERPEGPAIRVAPHSGGIVLAAVDDRGTAAFTADDLGQLRLWPMLDGTREPVVVRGVVPAQLALAIDGDGWLAAILDTAGGLELIRLSRDGDVKGRHLVGPDPGFEQIVAIPGGILALQRDQSILELDANGRVHGRLLPDPGERLLALASRRDRALVTSSTGGPQAEAVRWIDPSNDLAWGARIVLERALHASVAIAPTKPWIVGVDGGTAGGVVLDISAAPKVVASFPNAARTFSLDMVDRDLLLLGFIRDDVALISQGGHARWWIGTAPSPDPWSAAQAIVPETGTQLAVGDDLLLGAQGGTLSLATHQRAKHLGYAVIGTGTIAATEDGVALTAADRVLWLDRTLHATSVTTPEPALSVAPERTFPISDTVVLKVRSGFETMAKSGPAHAQAMGSEGILRDTRSNAETVLGTWGDVETVDYHDATRVVAITTSQGTERFRVDPTTLRATRMRPLASATGIVWPLDSARANGYIAVAYTVDHQGTSVRWFRDDPGPLEQQIQPASAIMLPPGTHVLGVDEGGAIHQFSRSERALVTHGPGSTAVVRKLTTPPLTFTATMDNTGALYVALTPNEVIAIDAAGLLRWRMPIWKPVFVQVSRDRRTVVVLQAGGLISFDAASGRRIAVGCGWELGLRDVSSSLTFNTPNVCAEEP